MEYGLVRNLRGFENSTVRVKVIRRIGDSLIVRTADLLDSGTALIVDADQFTIEEPAMVLRYREGLIAF